MTPQLPGPRVALSIDHKLNADQINLMPKTTQEASSTYGTLNEARGRRLQTARVAAGLEQQAVAERLGVTRGTMRRWERGYWLSPRRLEELAALYGVSLQEFEGPAAASSVSSPSAVAHPRSPRAVPQSALLEWVRFTVEAVEAGANEADLAFLRGLVLAPNVVYSNIADDELRLHVQAGIAAARTYIATRYPPQP
ncbi:helix-turn-helix domain-containing protein [Gemmatimonas sp. UBA7669]|uniref:helix-turn-helix domain-containing protein n=1 Tax=Gemmatimonas sp. UBA7669 TaxID=1946568 RepID=UPI0025BEBD60|nr:helix-turn-helix transcriptional regulator [Gemmatimonas sp. UBA7669]